MLKRLLQVLRIVLSILLGQSRDLLTLFFVFFTFLSLHMMSEPVFTAAGGFGQVLHFYLLSLRDVKERLPKLEASEWAYETETGRGITAQWNAMLSAPWLKPEFTALLRAAEKRRLLRQLLPVVSIGQYLSFSRTIGYPFAGIGACAAWGSKNFYYAMTPHHTVLKQGTIAEVLDIVEASVPPETGPAIYGTADDLAG